MSQDTFDRLLQYISKYGFATVACVVLFAYFVAPMRDGHLEFLQRTAETNDKTAEAVRAIQRVVEDGDERSSEHFRISQETNENVKEIKRHVVP